MGGGSDSVMGADYGSSSSSSSSARMFPGQKQMQPGAVPARAVGGMQSSMQQSVGMQSMDM
jgi:hypothetical protein